MWPQQSNAKSRNRELQILVYKKDKLHCPMRPPKCIDATWPAELFQHVVSFFCKQCEIELCWCGAKHKLLKEIRSPLLLYVLFQHLQSAPGVKSHNITWWIDPKHKSNSAGQGVSQERKCGWGFGSRPIFRLYTVLREVRAGAETVAVAAARFSCSSRRLSACYLQRRLTRPRRTGTLWKRRGGANRRRTSRPADSWRRPPWSVGLSSGDPRTRR